MHNYAETEKAIRAELAENFPGIQFSTEIFPSSNTIGNAAISLTWLDGPTPKAVRAITNKFDGLNDRHVCVISRRNFSRHFIESVVSQFCAVLKIPCIGVFGTKNDAWTYTDTLKDSERDHLYEIVYATDAKNQHRVYEALKEAAELEERERAEREAMKKAQAEREERERAEREAIRKAQTEREERERAEAEAERERVRQEQAQFARWRREQQEQQERARFAYHPAPIGRERALADLGLPSSATQSDVVQAFRRKVKAASDGKGGYTVDMDLLVKVKERALG